MSSSNASRAATGPQPRIAPEVEPSAAFTPGPWTRCGAARGGCSCGQVWCPDYPVAIVTRGEWGDGTDLRRVLRELWDHFRHKGFGFMAYGRVSDQLALANACLVSALPDLLAVAQTCAELAERHGEQGPLVRAARAAIAKALGCEAASPESLSVSQDEPIPPNPLTTDGAGE